MKPLEDLTKNGLGSTKPQVDQDCLKQTVRSTWDRHLKRVDGDI